MKASLGLVCFLLLVSCSERSFSGGTTVGNAYSGHSDAKPQVATGQPVDDSTVPPLPMTTEGSSEVAQPPAAETIDETSVTKLPEPQPQPKPDSTVIGGDTVEPPLPMPAPVPAPMPGTIDDTTVQFGSTEVFWIGNGFASGSSCLRDIATYNLSGTQYFFEFEVLNDSTSVNLSINRVCGVDLNSNYVNVLDANRKAVQQAKVLPPRVVFDGANGFVPFGAMMLNKGVYTVLIHSAFNEFEADNDDFIVGKITIKGDKSIKAGRVYTKQ